MRHKRRYVPKLPPPRMTAEQEAQEHRMLQKAKMVEYHPTPEPATQALDVVPETVQDWRDFLSGYTDANMRTPDFEAMAKRWIQSGIGTAKARRAIEFAKPGDYWPAQVNQAMEALYGQMP